MKRSDWLFSLLVPALGFGGCSSQPGTPDLGPSTFGVVVTAVNGSADLPTAGSPLPANHGTSPESWAFTVEARSPTGEVATDFNGFVRLTLAPGTVIGVTSDTHEASGRNIRLVDGKAAGVVQATAVYGPARLWIEDLGYVPAPKGATPQCSNGLDDNGNGLVDFPADPGCFFADDDQEGGGTYSVGVSPAVQYALPLVSDVRGAFPDANGDLIGGARTPYANEAIEVATADPQYLVVTRISSSGFYVTDVSPNALAHGYNSLYAFNFSTPQNLRVCDRVTYLAGTATDFYGATQLSFPSFLNSYVILGPDAGPVDGGGGIPDCRVPEPTLLLPFLSSDRNTTSRALYHYESGLVRLEGFTVAKYFGSGLAKNQNFQKGTSNCDFNGDGQIDFTQINCTGSAPCEGDCSNACDQNPDCTEWTAYSARGEYKVSHGGVAGTMIKVNTSTVGTFDPVGNAGVTIPYLTGTLGEFSGGSLNWTIEVRCPDDLVCPAALGCTTQDPVPSSVACVRVRTTADNDQGSN